MSQFLLLNTMTNSEDRVLTDELAHWGLSSRQYVGKCSYFATLQRVENITLLCVLRLEYIVKILYCMY